MTTRKHVYDWPRPAVTVDVALFTVAGTLQNLRLRVLLIQRGEEPFRGAWALPGGFVRENEDLEDAALRELQEESGVGQVLLEQVAAIGTPHRDPRGHTVTVLHVGLVAGDRYPLAAQGDAAAAQWFDVAGPRPLPLLAFDHAELLQHALAHLRRRLGEMPAICYELLPDRFTLSELQALTQSILGKEVDRRNFRRKIKDINLVIKTRGIRQQGRHRPAQLYRFDPKKLAEFRGRKGALPF
jgi:8-oxo-dGTP diphosphatase